MLTFITVMGVGGRGRVNNICRAAGGVTINCAERVNNIKQTPPLLAGVIIIEQLTAYLVRGG